MRELPPQELVARLERLRLATAEQMASVARRVGRLARDLPRFDSVWIDALAQARVVTPYQAAELNAGRGDRLRVGPYLLCERLAHPLYVQCYRARHVETNQTVRLAVIEDAGSRITRLKSIADIDPDGDRAFVAEPWVDGRTAAEWIVHHGRFPPQVVLEIARAMLPQLVELEKGGRCHGDVGTSSLLLSDSGDVRLMMPGLRGALRPEEGYAFADLRPEAYDALAPERVASGTPPNVAADVYGCGCLWWHLLCGRAPLSGGDSLTKLRAAQTGGICDVRRFAPDTSATFAAAISACVETEPNHRPESLARLAAMLGSPTSDGRATISDFLSRCGRPTVHWTTSTRALGRQSKKPLWASVAVCCLAALVALMWPSSRGTGGSTARKTPGESNVVAKASKLQEPGPRQANLRRCDENDAARSNTPETRSPDEVMPAAYQQPLRAPSDLVLSPDAPVNAAAIRLQAGQRVRPPSGRRAVVLVPEGGLIVYREGVRFESVDFVWNHASSDSATRGAAVVRLSASRAEFRGCSFRCADGDAAGSRVAGGRAIAVPGIRWIHPAEGESSDVSLPIGEVRMVDCLFESVGSVIDCQTLGALSIESTNTLCLGAGPFLRLDHCPRADEPISLTLSQFTLRGGGPLVECMAQNGLREPGEISIMSTACVFAPRSGESLVRCRGPVSRELLPRMLRWTGQGSLVTTETSILACGDADASEQTIDESSLAIAGLVRSDVEFAGRLGPDPATSRATRWQAPLRSGDPPGVDPAPLPFVSR